MIDSNNPDGNIVGATRPLQRRRISVLHASHRGYIGWSFGLVSAPHANNRGYRIWSLQTPSRKHVARRLQRASRTIINWHILPSVPHSVDKATDSANGNVQSYSKFVSTRDMLLECDHSEGNCPTDWDSELEGDFGGTIPVFGCDDPERIEEESDAIIRRWDAWESKMANACCRDRFYRTSGHVEDKQRREDIWTEILERCSARRRMDGATSV
ncbi:hypothetical protein BJ508DRAFT_313967 [Ascobolus immersus RN42]|uniref:Uncharacterized protein n=1 Tax=Ascobolus immersus RN42 TaxID=1160509 RepID=A0A3N4HGS3_ASCIM|nr:hypothetical protein BJ508DRAFT_313967 [Ascobolus immersus RN42]